VTKNNESGAGCSSHT